MYPPSPVLWAPPPQQGFAPPPQQGFSHLASHPSVPTQWSFLPPQPFTSPPIQPAVVPNLPSLLHNTPLPNPSMQPNLNTITSQPKQIITPHPPQPSLPPPPPREPSRQGERVGVPSAIQIEGKVFEVFFDGRRNESYCVV